MEQTEHITGITILDFSIRCLGFQLTDTNLNVQAPKRIDTKNYIE